MARYALYTLLILGLTSTALAWSATAPDDPNVVFIEMAGSRNPGLSGVQAGFGLYDDHTALLAGFSLLGSSETDELFAGIHMGGRFHPVHPFESSVTPFIGIGGFIGYSREEVAATNDDIDNDGDGIVDEEDETRHATGKMLSTIYPEAGIHLAITGDGLMTVATRYNVTTQGREFDHWMITLAFTFPFYF